MSATEARRVVTVEKGSEWEDGFARPRVVLQPIAAPSILGLYGFAAATFAVAAHLAGWYGNAKTPGELWPFALAFGGIAQLLAGMWAYRARDAVATAMHGAWGAFWIAFGIHELLVQWGKIPSVPAGEQVNGAMAMWFFTLGAVTAAGALAATAENLTLTAVLGTLAAGSIFLAIGNGVGSTGWVKLAGWVLVVSAILAYYLATAMMLAASAGKVMLPLGKPKADANKPGAQPVRPIELEWGEPGVKQGQ
jgi:uncharacterized protein